ncbi:MAG: hypothetical protein HQK77_21105 [Desulfobacterales bacterium]|nr:hypothetical protein [Desulfobacterales bacterium]
MALNRIKVEKILKEHFGEQTPLFFKNYDQQIELISKIKKELDAIPNVSVSSFYSSSKKDNTHKECSFQIEDTSGLFVYGNFFTLQFNENDALVLVYNDITANVSRPEMLFSFIEKMKSEFDRKKVLKTKREKINKLKQHAITAKIREIAKEDQFDFAIQEYENKLKLFVRVQKTVAEFDVPFHEFQEILNVIRTCVRLIKALNETKIHFKMSTRAGGGFQTWISHEEL